MPEYWEIVKEYMAEAEHGFTTDEIPKTFEKFISDLRLWVYNYS